MTKAINILSFNASLIPFVWHPYRRIKLFAKQEVCGKADILNLQEVHTYDILWTLRRNLSSFQHVSFKPGLIGPKAGLVSFSRIPFTKTAYTSLGTHKGILISELSTDIVLANVHLIANTDGDWSPENRFYSQHKSQLNGLNELLTRSDYKDKNIVLSGDFNLAKTCDLYTYFVDKGVWRDTAKNDFSPTFHAAFLPKDREPQRIDYIFTRGNLTVNKSLHVFAQKVNGHYLSNHRGLSVRLTQNK